MVELRISCQTQHFYASIALHSQEVRMIWRDRITVDPAVCHGKPCIKGTRVMVSVVLDNIAAGDTTEQIATTYRLAKDDVLAALQWRNSK